METTDFIPHSLIIKVSLNRVKLSIIIETTKGEYKTYKSFTTNANGIIGNFIKQ